MFYAVFLILWLSFEELIVSFFYIDKNDDSTRTNIQYSKTVLKNDNLKARIRYRQALQKVSVFQENNFYYFLFEKPQKSITSGQFIAVYSDDELVCSGVIH